MVGLGWAGAMLDLSFRWGQRFGFAWAEIWLGLEIWLGSRFGFIADLFGLGLTFGCAGYLVRYEIWLGWHLVGLGRDGDWVRLGWDGDLVGLDIFCLESWLVLQFNI